MKLANSAPTITAVSGLVENDGEFRLFVEKNVETSFTVRGSDDGPFTLHINSTLAGVGMTRNNNDTTVTLTLAEIDTAQKLRYINVNVNRLIHCYQHVLSGYLKYL